MLRPRHGLANNRVMKMMSGLSFDYRTTLPGIVVCGLLMLSACSDSNKNKSVNTDNLTENASQGTSQGSSESTTTNPETANTSVATADTIAATDDGRPWIFQYHGSDNFLSLQPLAVSDTQFTYAVDTDSAAVLSIIDDPIGMAAITSSDGSVSLSLPSSDSGFSSTVITEGGWDIQYQPNSLDESAPPYVIVRFGSSPYFLHVDLSTKQATNEGRSVKLEAYIARDGDNANDVALDGMTTQSDNALVPVTASFNVRIELGDVLQATVQLNDDGETMLGDTKAGDGVHSAIIDLTDAGNYRFVVTTNASIESKSVQREVVVHDDISEFRVSLVSTSANATPNSVFEQTLSEGQYGIPLLVSFNGGAVPDIVRVFGEIWATDNEGEKIRVVDRVNSLAGPVLREGEIYGLAVIIPSEEVPQVARFEKVEFRVLSLSTLDTGEDALVGEREFIVTGLP